MKDIIKQTVNSILEREGVKVTKIILFGSRARGDQTRKSDWDLLIVVDRNLSRSEKIRLGHLVRKELANQLIPCDILIRSSDEIEQRRQVIGSVIKTAFSEGVPL
ncbi:MAG: nucleotidyltransferase domain-containing protein [candidate division WOR-3 bacterium]